MVYLLMNKVICRGFLDSPGLQSLKNVAFNINGTVQNDASTSGFETLELWIDDKSRYFCTGVQKT